MILNPTARRLLKDARETYLALTAEEQALVTNRAILNEKITALTAAMGVELDFTKTYSEHFPTVEPPIIDPPIDNNGPDVMIFIIIGAVIVLAGAGIGYFVFTKKKNGV